MPTTTDRLRSIVAALTSPIVLLVLLPLMLLWWLNAAGLATWVLVPWGLWAIVMLALVGATLPPQIFIPQSTLSSELSKVSGLVRGGFGLFVAAVVGAVAAIAVQRDFTPETSGRGEILSLLMIVGEVLIAVVLVRVVFGIAFRFQIAGLDARSDAIRLVLARVIAVLFGARRLPAALRHPVYLHWHEVLVHPAAHWFSASVATVGAILGVSSFIQWVETWQ